MQPTLVIDGLPPNPETWPRFWLYLNALGQTLAIAFLGIVGAGGIGLHLSEQIRVLEWRQASFIILMVLITVAIIDQVSQRLRLAITGRRAS